MRKRDMKDIANIDATLDGGRFYSGFLKKFLLFTIILSLLGVVLIVIVALLNIKSHGVFQSILCLILGTFLFGGFAACMLYIFCQNRKREILIKEYLKDAVLLEASVTDISESLHDRIYNGAKIQVKFCYENIVHMCQSGNENSKKRNNGYDKVFRKFVNRNIYILYSPQYNQVLFLKNSFDKNLRNSN